MNKDLQRRIQLNNEFNPRITQYNKDATNNINPITGDKYLERLNGVESTRFRIGMGQIGRLWDEGEVYSSLSDYLHLQTVLGTMQKVDNIFEERENFENLVKNISKLDVELESINSISSLEKELVNLKEIQTLEVQVNILKSQNNYLEKKSSFFPYLV